MDLTDSALEMGLYYPSTSGSPWTVYYKAYSIPRTLETWQGEARAVNPQGIFRWV